MPRKRPVKKPVIHFVFTDHDPWKVKPLARRLEMLRKKRVTPRFLGIEGQGLKASARQTQDARLQKDLREFRGVQTDHPNLSKLMQNRSTQVKWIEAARPMQLKRRKRLIERMRSSRRFISGTLHMDNFDTAIAIQTKAYYNEFHLHVSRHKEVARNLRRELRLMEKNDEAIVMFGTAHKGLDIFSRRQLGIKTTRTTAPNSYTSIEDEIRQRHYANPKAKPTETELAQIALENILDPETLIVYTEKFAIQKKRDFLRFLKALKQKIKAMTKDEIRGKWTEAYDIVTDPSISIGEQIDELKKFARTL